LNHQVHKLRPLAVSFLQNNFAADKKPMNADHDVLFLNQRLADSLSRQPTVRRPGAGRRDLVNASALTD
jgi:hypothetical protein